MLNLVFSMALLFVLSLPEQGAAMRVKLLTLEQIVERAETIFVGRCLTSTAQDDPETGKTVTIIKFEVVEALKGNLGATHTLKQYGGMREHRLHRIAGIPTYTPGEEVILFLYAESEYGLTVPVGMSQGKFTFIRDEESFSPPLIANSINNNGLLTGLHPHMFMNNEPIDEPRTKDMQRLVTVNRGPIPYDAFLLLTKGLISRDKNGEK